MRETLNGFISLALAIILLVHLILLEVFHSLVIHEHNEYILGAEVALALFVIALNIERLVDDFRILMAKVKK